MNKKIYFDDRWIGNHGIGRVAYEINSRLKPKKLNLKLSPVSIFDSIIFFVKTLFLPKDAIVFSPGFNAPLFKVRKFTFIVHDLNHYDRPENSSFLKRIYYNLIIKRACTFANKIFTVSEFSKNRIIEWSSVNPEKVINISNGVDKHFCLEGIKFNNPSPYLLCVSNRKLHKNEERLIKSFAKAQIDNTIQLLFTGIADDNSLNLLNNLNISNRVKYLGKIQEEDLPSVYRGAMAMVFPSLYEGFGLPVIEAMSCGTPVLTSNTTSLAEVAGDAAFLVNPNDELEITQGIEILANNENLRKELINKGIIRAQVFTWNSVMEKINSVIATI